MLNDSGEDDLDAWPTGRLLSTAARLVEQAWEQTLRQRGLTHAGVIALHAVAQRPLSQREMARACRVTDQTMSRTVDHLVRGGFVTRAVDPDDERRMRVEITPAGLAEYHRALKVERDDTADGASPVAVSDPATLRRLLLEIVRAHNTPRDRGPDTPPGAKPSTTGE
ncbi:MarR family transcriptional regulator [Rhodococcus sp. Z13]|uniref:MarR family transcriptional regulator n=1 Tax=Rhodococcus sacchari TaxID=2962047 RepID=A0ACD4DGB2_9NOCA|nr:MarR family transcriptional regulator [Rhodococcus sp. Z13]UYP19097.1 MarR family transcriptional regulator [Rhodococcus sp. Z13]